MLSLLYLVSDCSNLIYFTLDNISFLCNEKQQYIYVASVNIYVASASYLLEFETTGMLLPLTKWEVF